MPAFTIPSSVASVLQESPRWKVNVPLDAETLKLLRVAEYKLGRELAQQALKNLGCQTVPLPTSLESIVEKKTDRSPVWPAGFVGSISHSNHWVWAAAGQRKRYRSIGIDTEVLVEPARAEELKQSIGRLDEFATLTRLLGSESDAVTVLFSVKEAFYKMWFPLTKSIWEFLDVELVDEPTIRHREGHDKQIEGTLMLRCRRVTNNLCAESVLKNLELEPSSPLPVSFQVGSIDVFSMCFLER